MGDYSVNGNSLSSQSFGSSFSDAGATFSMTSGVGKYLDDWYNNSISTAYKNMIATYEDGVLWYQSPGTELLDDYTKAKTGTGISATIGLPYYGEMFSSQFGGNSNSAVDTWLMTRVINNGIDYIVKNDKIATAPPMLSKGVRPSMYLKSSVKIGDVDGDGDVGNGTKEKPYEITM